MRRRAWTSPPPRRLSAILLRFLLARLFSVPDAHGTFERRAPRRPSSPVQMRPLPPTCVCADATSPPSPPRLTLPQPHPLPCLPPCAPALRAGARFLALLLRPHLCAHPPCANPSVGARSALVLRGALRVSPQTLFVAPRGAPRRHDHLPRRILVAWRPLSYALDRGRGPGAVATCTVCVAPRPPPPAPTLQTQEPRDAAVRAPPPPCAVAEPLGPRSGGRAQARYPPFVLRASRARRPFAALGCVGGRSAARSTHPPGPPAPRPSVCRGSTWPLPGRAADRLQPHLSRSAVRAGDCDGDHSLLPWRGLRRLAQRRLFSPVGRLWPETPSARRWAASLPWSSWRSAGDAFRAASTYAPHSLSLSLLRPPLALSSTRGSFHNASFSLFYFSSASALPPFHPPPPPLPVPSVELGPRPSLSPPLGSPLSPSLRSESPLTILILFFRVRSAGGLLFLRSSQPCRCPSRGVPSFPPRSPAARQQRSPAAPPPSSSFSRGRFFPPPRATRAFAVVDARHIPQTSCRSSTAAPGATDLAGRVLERSALHPGYHVSSDSVDSCIARASSPLSLRAPPCARPSSASVNVPPTRGRCRISRST